MRSIRLSLLVYFLGLLALALGVVSVLVYRTTQQTLDEKNKATALLIEKQYEELCAKERDKLDRALLADAQARANRAQIHPDPRAAQLAFEEWRQRATGSAVLMAAALAPNCPLSAAAGAGGNLNALALLPRRPTAEIQLVENDPEDPPDDGHAVPDYFQLQTSFPYIAAYPAAGSSLPLSQEPTPREDLLRGEYRGPQYYDFELRPGLTVRQVTFRTNLHVLPPTPRGTGADKPAASRSPWRARDGPGGLRPGPA